MKKKRLEEGKDQEGTLLGQEISLDGTRVTISILNEVQEIIFDKNKADLQVQLRKQLKNSTITLAIRREKVDPSKMIYTNREKFHHLSKQYPVLGKLKDELGLDTDF